MSVAIVQAYLPWISAMLFTEMMKNENISEAKNKANRPGLDVGIFTEWPDLQPFVQLDALLALAWRTQRDAPSDTAWVCAQPSTYPALGKRRAKVAQEHEPLTP